MRRADEFSAPPPAGRDDSFVSAEECARRMGVTLGELDKLVRRGAVRARRNGWTVEYEPCIVNVKPSGKPRSRRASGTTKKPAPRTPGDRDE